LNLEFRFGIIFPLFVSVFGELYWQIPVVSDSSVCSKHFRDMIYSQTQMARLIYDAADAAARVDHVLSLFLQGEVAHGDLIFNATLARAVGQKHHSPVQRFPIAMFISSTSRALRALIKCFPGTTHQFPAVFYESGAHLLCFCARRSRICQIL
jgi:hypothetical protein